MGEVRTLDLRHFLQGGSSGDPTVCLRDLGDYPQDMEKPQRIPPLIGPPYGGNASKVIHARAVGILSYGHSNVGGGNRLGGDIFPKPPEHHCPV